MARPTPLTVGIVGFGKIARTEHAPAIRASRIFTLHSIADRAARDVAVPHFADVESMLAAADAPAVIAVCTPPQARHAVARHALLQGRHVLLEKPPCATLGEIVDLAALAASTGSTLFCAWHSRFAPAVRPAREWLAGRIVRNARIEWREDVRVWHPQQQWIWEAGGLGVFDAGINALSIATAILPQPFFLRDAQLRVPENRATPIAAELAFATVDGAAIAASFDWLHAGPQTWSIHIETTDGGRLWLTEGGSRLSVDGRELQLTPSTEYAELYARFGELIAAGNSDADIVPFRLVADAFLRGRRETAPPFSDF